MDRHLYELCVENQGRPAAAALTGWVRAVIEAFHARYSMDRLCLQLELQPSDWSGAGPSRGLTASDRRYRRRWLDTVYMTLQLLAMRERGAAALPQVLPLRPWREVGEGADGAPAEREEEDELPDSGSPLNDGGDALLVDLIRRTLDGVAIGEEQLMVRFDRALATGGASGGVAAERCVIAPQFLPLSQLVLLTCKVRDEMIRAGA